jgi:hypothetical protein
LKVSLEVVSQWRTAKAFGEIAASVSIATKTAQDVRVGNEHQVTKSFGFWE